MNKRGYIYAIIGAILFGSAGLFVKLAYNTGLESISLLTLQYIIAVLLMFAAAFIKNIKILRVTLKELWHLAVLGIVGNTLMTVFYYNAFEYLPVAMVAMLLYTYPLMVFLYLWIFKGEKITSRKTLALILAFLGCILTLNIFNGQLAYSFVGVLYGLMSAVFYSFMNVYSETKLSKVQPLAINAYSTLFSLLSLMAYKFPKFLFTNELSMSGLKYTIILALFCEIIPLTLLYASIKLIGSLKVSIISNLEIPTAMVISLFLLREKVLTVQLLGSALIIAALYLVKERNIKN